MVLVQKVLRLLIHSFIQPILSESLLGAGAMPEPQETKVNQKDKMLALGTSHANGGLEYWETVTTLTNNLKTLQRIKSAMKE